MIEFGRTLRSAREAKGYTIAQITEMTHLAPMTVEALENEEFSRIPAPIYGRGFVKLYCEAVGLDPKPLIAEFMDIYTGNREPYIKESPVVAPEPPPAPQPVTSEPPPAEPETPTPAAPELKPVEPAPQPVAPEPPPAPQPDLFSMPEPPTVPQPVTSEPPPQAEPDFFSDPLPPPMPEYPIAPPDAPPTHQPRLSRYAAPISQREYVREPTPSFFGPAIWRIAALACGAIVLLWLGFLGVRALYRATSNTQNGDELPTAAQTAEEAHAERADAKKEAEAVKEAKPAKDAKASKEAKPKATAKPVPASSRKPQSIPSLYID